MNPPFEHGEPEDGDLVDDEPPSEIPPEVKEAIRTLIRWAGDDPDREGLLDTPRRVACAWRMPKILLSTSAAPSRKWADMTRSCF